MAGGFGDEKFAQTSLPIGSSSRAGKKVSGLDLYFIYLGSSVATMEEARKLFDCHLRQIDPESSSGIRPLNLDDPQTEDIPVPIERPGHHPPRGGNVVFLDGRCRCLKMGESFPMIEEFLQTNRRN